MDQDIFSGRLFKNDKSKLSTILIYVLIVVILGLLAAIAFIDNIIFQCMAGGVLVIILLAVGISRKLTFNEIDDKLIYISRNGIAIGTEEYLLSDLSNVGIYIDAFYGFRFQVAGAGGVKTYQSSYGMDNWMHFRAGGTKHSYRFVITNHQSYFLLEDILAAWRYDGRVFAWKENYGRAFVEKALGMVR